MLHQNQHYGLDNLSGSQVNLNNIKLEKNLKAGVHSSGVNSLVEIDNGFISNSQIGLICEDEALIVTNNLTMDQTVSLPIQTNKNGRIQQH